MKDWEISETYVLPRILCLRSGNNALLGKQSKPNLQFFSLNDRSNEWTTWNRSDYFYPEMIPEPDYSDSGDDVESEEDDGPYPRSAFERLRDLTEVYVSNVDSKKTPKKADSKKTLSTSETDLKQSKAKSKDDTKPTSKAKKSPPTSPKAAKKAGSKSSSEVAKSKGSASTDTRADASPKTSKAKKSPPTSPKAAKKAGSKSSSEVAKAKESASTDTRADASPKTRSKSPPKTKSPPPASKSSKTTQPKASPSTTKKGKTAVPETKKPSPPKAKPESRPKSSPPEPTKTKTDKPTTKGKTSPKSPPKAKSKGPAVAKMAKPGGDDGESSGESSPSSTSSKKTLSPTSSVISGEQSSDDEQLIKPKKPYSGSSEMQKLHKELKFSQKYGKPGATSKTELQLALERYTENKMKRELDAEEKTSLEKILEFQAKKIEMQQTMDKSPAWVDRLQKPPTAAPDPKIDEFYRVHARVVSSSILAHCFLSDDDRSECSSSRRSDSGSDS